MSSLTVHDVIVKMTIAKTVLFVIVPFINITCYDANIIQFYDFAKIIAKSSIYNFAILNKKPDQMAGLPKIWVILLINKRT